MPKEKLSQVNQLIFDGTIYDQKYRLTTVEQATIRLYIRGELRSKKDMPTWLLELENKVEELERKNNSLLVKISNHCAECGSLGDCNNCELGELRDQR